MGQFEACEQGKRVADLRHMLARAFEPFTQNGDTIE
jgi:hypothetical protein